MKSTLVFIDDGFLSKLSKFFGGGKYLKLHRKDFSELICKRERLTCEKIFVYTAASFQSAIPNRFEIKEKRDMIFLRSLWLRRVLCLGRADVKD